MVKYDDFLCLGGRENSYTNRIRTLVISTIVVVHCMHIPHRLLNIPNQLLVIELNSMQVALESSISVRLMCDHIHSK